MPIWRHENLLKFQYSNSTQILYGTNFEFSHCCDEIFTIFDLIAYIVTRGPDSEFLPFVIIDNVNSDHLYVVRLTNDPNATRVSLFDVYSDPRHGVQQLQAWVFTKLWSSEGLYDKSVSWIPNTDEILKLLKKKIN